MRADRSTTALACATILAVALNGPAGAQFDDDFEDEQSPIFDKAGRTVLFEARYVDVLELLPILNLLDAEVVAKPSLGVIAARSTDEGVLDTIRQMVSQLDVPPAPVPGIELSAYILAAPSGQASPSLPAELAEVGGQLDQLFGQREFGLLDTLFLRIGDGSSGRVEGSFGFGDPELPTGYRFHFDSVSVLPGEGDRSVRLDALTFEVTGENQAGVRRALLRTDVEIGGGRLAVIGKATPQGIRETLVIVVRAEVRSGG